MSWKIVLNGFRTTCQINRLELHKSQHTKNQTPLHTTLLQIKIIINKPLWLY